MNSTSILKVEFEMLLHKTYNMCNTKKTNDPKKKRQKIKKSKGFIKSSSQWKILELPKKKKKTLYMHNLGHTMTPLSFLLS
jgi:hypothetical protein